MPTYLEALTLRLAHGAGELAETSRRSHAAYLLAAQQADGGFAGRDGPSDVYYSGFALRGLALLGELDGPPAQRASAFLQSRLAGQLPIVDFVSLVFGASLLQLAAGLDPFAGRPDSWRQAAGELFEGFRRPDGGYAKTPEGQASSMYHTFLVLLCRQVLGLELIEPARLAEFVAAAQRADGGFVEISPMRRGGTNPTAAAIGILQLVGPLDAEIAAGAVRFLAEMQNDEGGLLANTRVPIADLLSSFTGLLTLLDLGATDAIDVPAVRRYAESLARPAGGFHAAAWDTGCDVEYSFYGLGTLALAAGAGR